MFVLASLFIGISISLLSGVFLGGAYPAKVAKYLYQIAVFLPATSVSVRRLHDVGRSGWWVLVPFVSVVMCCFDSQEGQNKYGANPKEPEVSQEPISI